MQPILPSSNNRIPTAPESPHDGGKDDPAIKQRFLQHERFLRNELMRFKIPQREQNIAVVILQASFGNQRRSVMIPDYSIFHDLLNYASSHVSAAMQSLKNMRVIFEEKKLGGTVYAINTDSRQWQVAPRVSREQVSRANELIRRFNGMPTGKGHNVEAVQKDIKTLIDNHSEGASTGDGGQPANDDPDQNTPSFLTDMFVTDSVISIKLAYEQFLPLETV
jgi:Bacteriophage replication protein O